MVAEAQILNCKQEAERWNQERGGLFWSLKSSTSSDTLPPEMSYILSITKQGHQLKSKYSNIQHYVGHCLGQWTDTMAVATFIKENILLGADLQFQRSSPAWWHAGRHCSCEFYIRIWRQQKERDSGPGLGFWNLTEHPQWHISSKRPHLND